MTTDTNGEPVEGVAGWGISIATLGGMLWLPIEGSKGLEFDPDRRHALNVKSLDRYLQSRRIGLVKPFLKAECTVIDIGCADGAMFQQLSGAYGYGYGVDTDLAAPFESDRYALYPGRFPDALPSGLQADLITLLAVIEHLPPDEQASVAAGCRELLVPGGVVVATVPSPKVDGVLHVLEKMRLVDGMSMHEHYGFDPSKTSQLFCDAGLELVEHRRFQLGLNNLFVFTKPAGV